MDAKQAIKLGIDAGDMIGMMYVSDLSDADLMKRPCAGCNHINWQVGHLIVSEHGLTNGVVPNSMPPLPAGFAEKYTKEMATSDDPNVFASKEELLRVYKEQRAATLAALDKLPEDKLDAPSGMDFVPTVGGIFALQGSHWLMHAGQWAVVRRQLGRKPLF
jgi:hypothetical protein